MGTEGWLWYAPLMLGAPWTIVGGFIGTMIGWWGGLPETIGSLLAAIAATTNLLLFSLPDGWLALTVPVHSWFGALFGLAVVGTVRLVVYIARHPG